MRPARLLFPLLFPLVAALPGCSGEDSSGTTGGPMEASDGKFHPPGNGMAMSESDACNTLTSAQSSRRQALGCAGTTRTCPEFLRAQFTTECLQYDQGSVQGCVAYYEEKKSCVDLNMSVDECAVTPLAGTAPMGCPK
jgi:hypothetical protein